MEDECPVEDVIYRGTDKSKYTKYKRIVKILFRKKKAMGKISNVHWNGV